MGTSIPFQTGSQIWSASSVLFSLPTLPLLTFSLSPFTVIGGGRDWVGFFLYSHRLSVVTIGTITPIVKLIESPASWPCTPLQRGTLLCTQSLQCNTIFTVASGLGKEGKLDDRPVHGDRRIKITDLEARSRPMFRSNSELNRRSLQTESICPRLRLLSGALILSCQWTRSSTIQVCQHRVPSPHLSLQFPSAILWTSLPHYTASLS